MPTNKQIHLDNRPDGEATASNFKLVTSETPALADNQVLVRHHYLSLDPYMRGRMNDAKSYAAPQALGGRRLDPHQQHRVRGDDPRPGPHPLDE